MKKQNKDDESSYGLGAFISVGLTILIHWLFLSNINLHPTLHAGIGIGIFFLFAGVIDSILSKFW